MSVSSDSISKIFDEAQELTFSTDLGIKRLKDIINFEDDLFEELNKNQVQENILQEFTACLDILISTSNSHRAHFVIEFLVKFLTHLNSNSDENFFQYEIINYLLSNSRASSDLVRLRICDIVHKFLEFQHKSSLRAKAEMEQKLYFKMQLFLTERMRDRDLSVQKLALRSAFMLQTPTDKYCPVINSLIHLLKHESLVELKLLIIDSIAVNNLTYNLFKNELIYDSSKQVRLKTMSIMERKIPIKFIDAKIKKNIIDVLLRDGSLDLLEKFVYKFAFNCAEQKLSLLQLIEGLKLSEYWLTARVDQENQLDSINQTLGKIVEIFFGLKEQQDLISYVIDLNKLLTENYQALFENVNLAFYLHAITFCYARLGKIETLRHHLIIDMKKFVDAVFAGLRRGEKTGNFAFFYLIDVYFCVCGENLNFADEVLLNEWLNSIRFEEDSYVLYDLVVGKFEANKTGKFLWSFYKNFTLSLRSEEEEETCKLLAVICVLFAKLEEEDFHGLELLDEIDLMDVNVSANSSRIGQNVMEFLLQEVVLANISNLNPGIRRLSVKALGLACLTDHSLAESYIHLLTQIVVLDYPEVVAEAQKSLYNITVAFSERAHPKEEDWQNMLATLENQLDCLSDLKIRYLAHEGFAKLLILTPKLLPNKETILFKLLSSYLTEEYTDANNNLITIDLTLKSCLCTFFDIFKRLSHENAVELTSLALPLLNTAIEHQPYAFNVKKVADYFYFLTYGASLGLARLTIISQILNKLISSFNDFNKMQRWLDALLEFNVHAANLECEEARGLLKQVLVGMEKVMKHVKLEKWKLRRDGDFREFCEQVKNLVFEHCRVAEKRKREPRMEPKKKHSAENMEID